MRPASAASSSDEVDRLRQVYRSYDADVAVQRRWSHENEGNRAIAAQRAARAQAVLHGAGRWPSDSGHTLDLGCGSGGVIADLFGIAQGPSGPSGRENDTRSPLIGLDLSAERLRSAAERLPAVAFVQAEGSRLPFPAERFDLVLTFTLFSSVRDIGLARAVAGEIARVLRPGGAVLWYDMRLPNPANRNTRAMSKRAVRALFPGFAVDLAPVTVVPPVARHLGRATTRGYGLLTRIGPLNSHALGVLVKPE